MREAVDLLAEVRVADFRFLVVVTGFREVLVAADLVVLAVFDALTDADLVEDLTADLAAERVAVAAAGVIVKPR